MDSGLSWFYWNKVLCCTLSDMKLSRIVFHLIKWIVYKHSCSYKSRFLLYIKSASSNVIRKARNRFASGFSTKNIDNICRSILSFNTTSFETAFTASPPFGYICYQGSSAIWKFSIRFLIWGVIRDSLCPPDRRVDKRTVDIIYNISTVVSTKTTRRKCHCEFCLIVECIFNSKVWMPIKILTWILTSTNPGKIICHLFSRVFKLMLRAQPLIGSYARS